MLPDCIAISVHVLREFCLCSADEALAHHGILELLERLSSITATYIKMLREREDDERPKALPKQCVHFIQAT